LHPILYYGRRIDCLCALGRDHGTLISDVNNGDDRNYEQSTPKQRTLAFLYDIKKKQSAEWVDKTIASISEPEVNSSVATVAE
jgi:hypothetical protein